MPKFYENDTPSPAWCVYNALEKVCEIQTDPHDEKVVQAYTISRLFHLALDVGWHEHTNDWDVCITITLCDGSKLVAWGFEFDDIDSNTASPVDYDSIKTFRCQVFNDDYTTDRMETVNIDDISRYELSDTGAA